MSLWPMPMLGSLSFDSPTARVVGEACEVEPLVAERQGRREGECGRIPDPVIGVAE